MISKIGMPNLGFKSQVRRWEGQNDDKERIVERTDIRSITGAKKEAHIRDAKPGDVIEITSVGLGSVKYLVTEDLGEGQKRYIYLGNRPFGIIKQEQQDYPESFDSPKVAKVIGTINVDI